MRKPKSRAVREVPVSQGRSFAYFAPSLSLPHYYFFSLPTCSVLKLQQIQRTVKVHYRWGFLTAPHGCPWSLPPPKGAFVIEGRVRSSLIPKKGGERARKGGHGPGGQGNRIGFGLSALPRACWAVWGTVLSLFVTQRV